MIQGQSYGWGDLLKIADEAGFTPLPVGEYDVIVASAKAQATNSGKDSIVVQFRVVSGPQANRQIRNQFTISPENPNAVGFFMRHMNALGLPREYFEQNPTMSQLAQVLLNRPCRIKVNHREFGGAVRDNVEAIMPPASQITGVQPGVPTAPAPAQMASAPVAPPVAPPAAPAAPPVSPAPPAVPTPQPAGPQWTAPQPEPPASAPSAPVAATPVPSPGGFEVAAPPPSAPAPVLTGFEPPALPTTNGNGAEVPPELPF